MSMENYYALMLGLPNDVANPDHYQLLGLQQNEPTPDIIRNAAAEQNRKLLKWQNSEKYHRIARTLMQEVAMAMIALQDAQQPDNQYKNGKQQDPNERDILTWLNESDSIQDDVNYPAEIAPIRTPNPRLKSENWYYRNIEGNIRGPLPKQILLDLLLDSTLPADTPISSDAKNWHAASDAIEHTPLSDESQNPSVPSKPNLSRPSKPNLSRPSKLNVSRPTSILSYLEVLFIIVAFTLLFLYVVSLIIRTLLP